MNRTLPGLAVMVAVMGATVARADDCGPQPTYAPRGEDWNQGQYQLQTTQVWVQGQVQEVYVPGLCHQWGHVQVCTPGTYETVATAGRYETRQDWVWVANVYQRAPQQYGRGNGRGSGRDFGRDFGRNQRWGRHGAAPIGY